VAHCFPPGGLADLEKPSTAASGRAGASSYDVRKQADRSPWRVTKSGRPIGTGQIQENSSETELLRAPISMSLAKLRDWAVVRPFETIKRSQVELLFAGDLDLPRGVAP
jgi:hypothetical protein